MSISITHKDRIFFTGAEFEKHSDFWKGQFELAPEEFRFTDFYSGGKSSGHKKGFSVTLGEDITAGVFTIANKQPLGIFVVLLSGLEHLLAWYMQREQVTIHTPLLKGAAAKEFYTDTVALVNRVQRDRPLRELIGACRDCVLKSYSLQNFPAGTLYGASAAATNMACVFPEIHHDIARPERYDLVLNISRDEKTVRLDFSYDDALFNEAFLSMFAAHYANILKNYNDTSRILKAEDILSEGEKASLLNNFPVREDYPFAGLTIHEAFGKIAAAFPERIALRAGEKSISYRELDEISNSIAHYLRIVCRISPGDSIAVKCDRSERHIIALLAIIKSGAAYLPVDEDYPALRIDYILNDAKPKAILLCRDENPAFDAYDGIFISPSDWLDADPQFSDTPERLAGENDPAYIIYTSGSSGEPKGVVVEHRNFINMISEQIRIFDVRDSDRVLLFASPSFDASLSEIFMSLLSGACLVLPGKEIINNTERFTGFMEEQKVSVITLPPGYLRLLGGHPLPSVRTLITAGEAPDPDEALFYAQTRRYFNAYGPTEVAVCASVHVLDASATRSNPVPVGRPLANTRIYILSEKSELLPPGATGEICIAGAGVARGYLNREELTKEKFTEDPFKPGERLYRSGDLGRWLPDASLEFLGRRDEQVKIHGYRIETGEIEAALRQHTDIRDAAVAVFQNGAGEKELCAYYSPKNKVELFPSIAEFFVYDELAYGFMARDEERNRRYKAAFGKVLSDKTVLEIGPGPELILSRLALEAGAKKIYAVEILKETYEKARLMIARLGLEEKIHLIHGDITKVELPEKVDYCISEIVGAIGGSEGSAKLINSARKFLHDPSRMLPERSLTKIAAVQLQEGDFDYAFSPVAASYVEKIFAQTGYEFDLRLCLKNFPSQNILSDAAPFEDLDYTKEVTPEAEHTIRLEFKKDGLFNGFLVWLNLYVDRDECIDILELRDSWIPVYLPLSAEGMECRKGDRIEATIERRLCSNWLNPDFFIKGTIFRANGETSDFRYESLHFKQEFRSNPFYEKLFGGNTVPVKQDLNEANLRRFLAERLPQYMIPQHFTRLDAIPLTVNGKTDKKALPRPATGTAEAIAAPRTENEKVLAGVFSEVLGRTAGANSDFFALGGDSIKAIQIVSRLYRKELKTEVQDVFRYPVLSDLAAVLAPVASTKDQSEVSGDIALGAIQNWFFATHGEHRNHFNQALMLKGIFDEGALVAALKAVQKHHDALRMSYVFKDGEILQKGHTSDNYPFFFELLDLRGREEEKELLQNYCQELQESIDLEHGPLMKCALIRLSDGDRLFIVIHHLATDGVSWRIVLEDLRLGYEQYERGEEIILPQKTDSFRRWADEIRRYDIGEDERLYWQALEDDMRKLPAPAFDGGDAAGREEDVLTEEWRLDETELRALQDEGQRAFGASLQELLLAGLAQAFNAWQNGKSPLVPLTLEGHGREAMGELDVTRTVGWFTSAYPVLIRAEESLRDSVDGVRKTLRSIPAKGIGYGILRYVRQENFIAKPDLIFNFLGEFGSEVETDIFGAAGESAGRSVSGKLRAQYAMSINAMIAGGELQVALGYDSQRISTRSARDFLSCFGREIHAILDLCRESPDAGLSASELSYGELSEDEFESLFED